MGHVRGDDGHPGLPAAPRSQAGSACCAATSPPSCPPFLISSFPAAKNTSPLQVHLSFCICDLKAAGWRVRALGVAKEQLELGHSPRAAVVMADACPVGPQGGCKGLEHWWGEASMQHRLGWMKELCHDILAVFEKTKIKPMVQSPMLLILCSRCWGLQVGWPGWWVAKGRQQLSTTPWLGLGHGKFVLAKAVHYMVQLR